MAEFIVKKCKIILSLAFVFVECLCYAVTFVGWPNLVEVFKREGIFSQLCNSTANQHEILNISDQESNSTVLEETVIICTERDKLFNLCFSIASVAFSVSSFFVGLLFDKFGLWITRIVGTIFYLTGVLLLAFTEEGGRSYLIFPGLSFMAIGGMHIVVTASHLSLQAGNKKSTVATLNSGAMDSGVIILLCVKLAFDYSGISHQHSLIFLAALWSIVLFNTFVLSPRFKVDVSYYMEKEIDMDQDVANSSEEAIKENTRSNLLTMKFTDCLKSPFYLLMLVWFSMNHLRFLYTVGSLNSWLLYNSGGDQEKVSSFVNIFSYIAFGGILAAPVSGTVTDYALKRGIGSNAKDPILQKAMTMVPALLIGSTFTLLHSFMTIFPTPATIYMSFVLLTIQRAFTYGNLISYMAVVFPMHLFGKCFGLGFCIGGVWSCLQYALFIWAEELNSYQNVSIFLTFLMLAILMLPIYILVSYKRDKRESDSD